MICTLRAEPYPQEDDCECRQYLTTQSFLAVQSQKR